MFRFKRWQPKAGRWIDWGLRRPSARRREAIRKAEEQTSFRKGRRVDLPSPSAIGAHDSGCLTGGPFSFRNKGMSDEAHFPAEQSGPQAASRLPQPDGDRAAARC